ncbi:MAG: exodeoxyribonuclease VII large subunit [Clostridia bacterium]|nr:exodeoxyribonuclease VII large subunit [Clostridia bacterium]
MISETLTVTELNTYIKALIDSDDVLSGISVKGEISNFKAHSSGHLYFTLKDENSLIRAVMFRSSASRVPFSPENGMKVICRGRVSVFPRDGQYQFYADVMEPDGIGSLYLAFEQLKNKLSAEGLFDPAKKKPIPKIPSSVGLITSPTGAAVRDMINVTGRRFPYAKIILYPALVQGPDAPADLVEALKYFNDTGSVDVIIIGRGGGSIEDLWAFNDEGVARAVAASRIPVISAVGHETDFTICDFAADKRAATPSQAAEFAVPDTEKLRVQFQNVVNLEAGYLISRLSSLREKLTDLSSRRVIKDPGSFIDERRILIDMRTERLSYSFDKTVLDKKSRLSSVCAKLETLSPLSVISRGYSAVTDSEGRLVKNVDQLRVGDTVSFRTGGGEADAEITEIRKGGTL